LTAMTLAQLFALSLVCLGVDSARVQSSVGESDFVCPSECLECCDSSSFFGIFGRSFKCILRDTMGGVDLKTPASRDCEEPSQRNSYNSQYKVHCKYHDGESVASKKCSETHVCCCGSNGNWHEAQCLDILGEDGTVQAMANHTGQMETFRMRSEQVFANEAACRRPGNEHHPYDSKAVPGNTHSRPQSKSYRATGCCLETETHSVKHHWYTSHPMRMGKVTTIRRTPHSKDVDYTICVRHEELHYCSDDNGLTVNGKYVYDSVSRPEEGKCYGDEQPTDGKQLSENDAVYERCPQGLFKGDWCQCPGNCGNMYRPK